MLRFENVEKIYKGDVAALSDVKDDVATKVEVKTAAAKKKGK